MTLPTHLTLTDDEVVALSARARKVWPTAVPTIDRTDVDAVSRGVASGARSLVVRGLLDAGEDRLSDDLAVLLVPILEGELVWATYLAARDDLVAPVGLASAYYRGQEAWVAESISAGGLRVLRTTTYEECADTTCGLLSDSLPLRSRDVKGGGTRGPEYALCAVGALTRPGTLIVTADDTTKVLQAHEAAPGEPLVPTFTIASAQDALTLLLGGAVDD